ncbi:hypothetical protein HMPREF9099_02102 [Lachnospiraceae bacterium oral taxon 082 str. F0431]|nr:hypothetical protein HMPREF9099_02102 [Lachnospiraceae bacterium oral taxon 082 str. F0431]
MSVSFKTNRTYKRKDIYEETDFNVIHGFFTLYEYVCFCGRRLFYRWCIMGHRKQGTCNWDEAEDKTKYKVQLFKGNKKIGSNIAQVLQSMISQNLLSTTEQEAIHSRYIR